MISGYQIAITAHSRRRRMATRLAEEVKATVIWDRQNLGCEQNSIRTFEHLEGCGREWAVRLEDDVLVVPDFRRQLSDALSVAPSPIVSLYLGRGRPISHDGITGWQDRISKVILKEVCWVLSPRLLSAQAVAIDTELIPSMLERIRPLVEKMPFDDAISQWCQEEGLEVAHCRPSLVNHRVGPTIIKEHHDGQPRTELRVAWLWDGREHWDSSSVRL